MPLLTSPLYESLASTYITALLSRFSSSSDERRLLRSRNRKRKARRAQQQIPRDEGVEKTVVAGEVGGERAASVRGGGSGSLDSGWSSWRSGRSTSTSTTMTTTTRTSTGGWSEREREREREREGYRYFRNEDEFATLVGSLFRDVKVREKRIEENGKV